jgi:hypothetical protein
MNNVQLSKHVMVKGFAEILASAKVQARKSVINELEDSTRLQSDPAVDFRELYWDVLTAHLEDYLPAALAFCAANKELSFISDLHNNGQICCSDVFSKLVTFAFKMVAVVNDNG